MAKNEVQLRAREILHKRVLILGEVGSGKTRLATRLLQELMTFVSPEKITVIDMAPERVGEIGGKITDYTNPAEKIRYLSPKTVYTPRATGTTREQVLHYAEQNRKNMELLLNEYIQNATEILILNDVTLYLHSGKLKTILKCTKLASTFLATAYHGSKLAKDLESGITLREKRLTKKLASSMDKVIRINQQVVG